MDGIVTRRAAIKEWRTKYAPSSHQYKKSSTSNAAKNAAIVGKRPRDMQRSKLYLWERKNVWPNFEGVTDGGTNRPMSFKEVTVFANRIFSDFTFSTPNFKWGNGRKAYWMPSTNTINYPPWSRCTPILIHEIAHALIDYLYTEKIEAHGAEYVAMYIHLLGKYGGLDTTMLYKSARLSGLRVSTKVKTIDK